MKITKQNLDAAVQENIISSEQAEKLFLFLKENPSAGPRFDFTHVLYYLGGLIAINAMTLFMTLGWEMFGGWGILAMSLAYAVLALKLTHTFQQKGYPVPAGICATFVVALTPLAIYGLQQGLGIWPDDTAYREYHRLIKWHWLYMELGTLAVGVIVAWKYKHPFLIMPIAVTLWYMSMDIAAMLAAGSPDFELRAIVSMYFGLAFVCLAFWVDIRARNTADYAFWLYIFGVMTFWGGMTLQYSDSELARFFYFCINIFMLGIGVALVRRVFVVFGAIGCCIYLGHLAYRVFEDSWLFPIMLTVLGFTIIYLGVLWQKNEPRITAKMRSVLPLPLRELLEARSR